MHTMESKEVAGNWRGARW